MAQFKMTNILLIIIIIISLKFSSAILPQFVTIINLTRNFTANHKLNKNFWKNTGMCPPQPINQSANWYLSSDMTLNLQIISSLSSIGGDRHFYVRAHWLFDIIQNDNKTNQFDTFINNLHNFNLNPSIEFMGTALNYNLTFSLFRQYIDWYGAAWFKKWRFETWNEPDLRNFNINNFDLNAFTAYIDKTRGLVNRLGQYIKGTIKLHGPAGLFKNELKHPFCWHALERCNQNLVKCPFDVITFHRKGYDTGSANEILNGTIDLVRLIVGKFPNLKRLAYANDESDPLSGWSKPSEFYSDVRYASIFVSSILLHLNAKYEKVLEHLKFLSNDNAFLSYYPFQFEQRTLLARFQINNTNPPHIQFFAKPIYAAAHLLNNLDKISDKIANLDNNYVMQVTKNRKVNATFYSAIVTPSDVDRYTVDRDITIKLDLDHFADDTDPYYVFAEILENKKTDPFAFWNVSLRRIPYPCYKKRGMMRARQYPIPLQSLALITNTSSFIYNVTSPFAMSIRIVNAVNISKRPAAPTRLRYMKIYRNFEILLSWQQPNAKFIKSYELYFRKTLNWVCVTCDQHMPFQHYQYQRYGVRKNILGAYKVRAIDLLGRRSKFSDVIKVY